MLFGISNFRHQYLCPGCVLALPVSRCCRYAGMTEFLKVRVAGIVVLGRDDAPWGCSREDAMEGEVHHNAEA